MRISQISISPIAAALANKLLINISIVVVFECSSVLSLSCDLLFTISEINLSVDNVDSMLFED
ncbi:hypothetical protein BDV36DRAFT_248859, partial [Aspergillus pseudocaelatus]